MDNNRQDSMKAVVATDYGPPERYALADVPVPRPGPGQLRIRIAAASVNPADVRLPGGDFRDVVEAQFPYIPGVDFAGTVVETGESVSAPAWLSKPRLESSAVRNLVESISRPIRSRTAFAYSERLRRWSCGS